MKLIKYIQDIYRYWINVRYIMPDYKKAREICKHREYQTPSFYDDIETVDMIIRDHMSLSRFGDGEFGWMAGKKFSSFQDNSDLFAEHLRKAFTSEKPKLLIGIPKGLFYTDGLNTFSKMFWTIIKTTSYDDMIKFVNFNRIYVNASITRPYIDYTSRKFSKRAFENIKRIWNERDVIIVEGENSKLGIGNDLFNNVSTIKRIICPGINAYEKIEEIKKAIYQYANESDLILGALGPTASILASDLSTDGFQFIDIGHIDVEYMWYLNRSILRDPIPGKYVNESKEKMSLSIYDNDEKYQKSILIRIL